jgi:hypothetical protein
MITIVPHHVIGRRRNLRENMYRQIMTLVYSGSKNLNL